MATIPLWVIGANVSAFSIAPCSVDATGQITINTALSLRGRWQEFSFQPKYELKEIAAADQFVKSKVPTALSATIMIKEIEQLAPQIGDSLTLQLTSARDTSGNEISLAVA